MSVLIAIPCYQNQMHLGCVRSLLGIQSRLKLAGVRHDFLLNSGDSLVTRARSNIAAGFLELDFDTLAMLDSDCELDFGDFHNLYNMNHAIRGAAVNLKTPDFSECLSVFRNGRRLRRADMTGTEMRVDRIGGAVLFVERHVLEVMTEKAPPGTRFMDKALLVGGAHLFADSVTAGTIDSEDYAFCDRARAAGFEIWLEPSIRVGHWEGRCCWKH